MQLMKISESEISSVSASISNRVLFVTYWLIWARTEGTTGSGLSHIPLENLLLWDSSLLESSNSSGAAPAEGTNDDHLWHTAGLLGTLIESGLDMSNQGILVGIALDTREGLVVVQLPGPDLDSKGCSSKASVESKRLGLLVSH